MQNLGDIFVTQYGRPLRPGGSVVLRPDWRWAHVLELTAMRETMARARLEAINDPAVTSAYEFKLFSDRNFDVSEYDYVQAAYALWTEHPGMRSSLEAYLLCDDLSVEDVAHRMRIQPGDVAAYSSIFFDVRSGLNNIGWMCTILFGDLMASFSEAFTASRLGKLHRMGWFFGSTIVDYYCDIKKHSSPEVRNAIGNKMKDIAYRYSMAASFCKTHVDESNIAVIQAVLTDIKDRAAEAAGVSPNDNADAVMAFFNSTPLSVASPAEEANKMLPRREKRVHEILAENPVALLETAK